MAQQRGILRCMTANDTPTPRRRRIRHRRCKLCATLGTWTAPISARGMCASCGAERLQDSIIHQREKSGWVYRRWAEAMVRVASEAMGGPVLVSLPNEITESPGQTDVDASNMM